MCVCVCVFDSCSKSITLMKVIENYRPVSNYHCVKSLISYYLAEYLAQNNLIVARLSFFTLY